MLKPETHQGSTGSCTNIFIQTRSSCPSAKRLPLHAPSLLQVPQFICLSTQGWTSPFCTAIQPTAIHTKEDHLPLGTSYFSNNFRSRPFCLKHERKSHGIRFKVSTCNRAHATCLSEAPLPCSDLVCHGLNSCLSYQNNVRSLMQVHL